MIKYISRPLVVASFGYGLGWLFGSFLVLIGFATSAQSVAAVFAILVFLCAAAASGESTPLAVGNGSSECEWSDSLMSLQLNEEASDFRCSYDDCISHRSKEISDETEFADAQRFAGGSDPLYGHHSRGLSNSLDVALAISGCPTGTDADILLPMAFDDHHQGLFTNDFSSCDSWSINHEMDASIAWVSDPMSDW